jgi:hypothetical protein
MKDSTMTRFGIGGTRWLLAVVLLTALAGVASADVPGDWSIDPGTGATTLIAPREGPAGSTIPNPGTQQKELANITFDMGPAYYNVFEFPVTCMACHGGIIMQQMGHGSVWGGSSMASATRDPVFRANQIIFNNSIVNGVRLDGAGNMCFRCHSPNSWLSGRIDPLKGGAPDGSGIFHTVLASTDDEGVMCETCHRAVGNVSMKRPGLSATDPAWNMLAGLTDWPHTGGAYPAGPLARDPYGEATLQFDDGMTYGAIYQGNVNLFFSDNPLPGTPYTGQTYGVYPPGYIDYWGNDRSGQPVVSPDGSTPIHYEYPALPPVNPYDQAISPEHSTFRNDFVRSPQFCGSCHDMTFPLDMAGLPAGMPEQRTYTEWKYSSFGLDAAGNPKPDYLRCQDCHMPRTKHEFDDQTPASLNVDPIVAGWFPYAKDRAGGTVVHKLAGSNFGLPEMMKLLYPEVDLEVVGEPTLDDPTVFPGMLSDRSTMWDRSKYNSQILLKDAVKVEIVQGPTPVGAGVYQVQVKVTNNTGHKIPSGYPDGRRFWISLDVRDAANARVYQSGNFVPASTYTDTGFDYAKSKSARLYNDSWSINKGLNRALSNNIGSPVTPVKLGGNNEVMIYEKRTGSPDGAGNYTVSPSLLNGQFVFDNRIPPFGWEPVKYEAGGAKFWTYDRVSINLDDTATATAANPRPDMTRYPAGANYDIVTYTFDARGKIPVRARAEIYWQIHPRSFMEHLRDSDQSALRPEGAPILYEANYPLTPNYLSQDYNYGGWSFRKKPLKFAQIAADPFASPAPTPPTLRDNWGGVSFAAWFRTGLGAPFFVTAADTQVAGPPAAPTAPTITGEPNGHTLILSWNQVAGADGYVLWVRYGLNDTTAAWDRLAVLNGPASTKFRATALNPDKTHGFRVQAFNAAGMGPFSGVLNAKAAAGGRPLMPEMLTVKGTGSTWIQLMFTDTANNESGFIIQRQRVDAGGPVGPFRHRAKIGPAGGANVEVTWTDSGLHPNRTYNYRVCAYIAPNNRSAYTLPVMGTTLP